MTIPDKFKEHENRLSTLEIKYNFLLNDLKQKDEKIRQLENALNRK